MRPDTGKTYEKVPQEGEGKLLWRCVSSQSDFKDMRRRCHFAGTLLKS
jgi:hypothetical protein